MVPKVRVVSRPGIPGRRKLDYSAPGVQEMDSCHPNTNLENTSKAGAGNSRMWSVGGMKAGHTDLNLDVSPSGDELSNTSSVKCARH